MPVQWQVGLRRRRGLGQANGLRLVCLFPQPGAPAKMREDADAPAPVTPLLTLLTSCRAGLDNKHRAHMPCATGRPANIKTHELPLYGFTSGGALPGVRISIIPRNTTTPCGESAKPNFSTPRTLVRAHGATHERPATPALKASPMGSRAAG